MSEVMTTSRSDRTRGGYARWRIVSLLAVMSFVCPAAAQEKGSDEQTSRAAKYILRTPDGSEIPLSDLNVSDQDIEDLIRNRRKPDPKSYVIRKLEIEGRVNGDVAFLNATWTVHLNEDSNQWVSVPIGLDEGKATDIAKHKHGDNGRAQQDTVGSTESGTRRWFFRGQGDHTLTLPLVVPVREPQHLRHTLRFRLPAGISATKLAIQVPHRSIQVEPPRGSGLNTERTQTGTTINVWGLAPQFNLQWDIRPNIADARPFLRSRTSLTVDLSTAPFAISAKQTLVMQQGSDQVFDVTIPEGFNISRREPQQVDPTGRVKSLDFEPDGRRVRVELAEPLTNQLELKWVLTATDTTLLRRWKFGGVLVKGAQEQSTDLELTPREGVEVREIKSEGVQRKFGTTRSTSRVTRASFTTDDSQLVVELGEVEPFFAVTPRMALILTNGQLRLEARFRVRVLRGSVQEINLRWPGFAAEGWELQRLGEELTLPTPLGEGLVAWTQDAPTADAVMPLRLSASQSGTFEFAIIADRKVSGTSEFPLSLPVVEARIRQAASLAIATEQTTQLALKGKGETTTDQLPGNTDRESWLDLLVQRLNVSNIAIRSEQREFAASVTVRERSVVVPQNRITLELFNKSVSVKQGLKYRVQFGHVTEVRLQVPAGTEPTVSLGGATLNETSVAEASRIYELPEPTTGDFEINVAYQRPYTLKNSIIALPIISSDDAAAIETRVGVRPDAYYRVQLNGEGWASAFSRDLDGVWISTRPVERLGLSASSPLRAMTRRFSVSRALVQTRVAGDVAESRASFVLQGRFENQVLSVPADTTISSVAWNGESLPPDRWAVDRLIDTRVLTVDQRQITGNGVLTVDFRSSVPELTWARDARLQSVTLPDDVPIDEVIWQVILPTGEHLSGFDRGNVPCFQWALTRWGWLRQPVAEFADLSEWLAEGNNRPAAVVRTVAGNSYAFQQPGLKPLEFSTLDQSVVLFLGALVAFATGFILARFSPRRFAVVLPTVGVLLSLLSLRYAPAMQLLAQPALVGIALAAVAQTIDRRRHKRGYNPYRAQSRVQPSALEEPTVASPASLSGTVP